MSHRNLLLVVALAVVSPDGVQAQRPRSPLLAVREPALQVIAAFDVVMKRDLWPGFRPDTIPLAIFDGNRTWLVRHPSPPDEFRQQAPGSRYFVMEGRHPEVTANSSATIGGRTTATLIPDFEKQRAAGWASVAAHEAFHVFQRLRHPTWIANEAVLFTYPWEDADALAERRLEFDALHRALLARDKVASACWASKAMAERDARFARLGAEAAAYETKSELNEGIAQYIQNRAAGTDANAAMRSEEFPPSGVRDRVYATGGAMGQLLDRLNPAWRTALEDADTGATLHGMLKAAIAKSRSHTGTCDFRAADRAQALATANHDIAEQRAQLAAQRDEFANRAGWSIVVDASAQPLNLAGFDPLNVARLSPSEVLHRRYVKLANDAGEFESMTQEAMTESAGSHPIFSGVRRVSVAGLTEAPAVDETGGSVEIRVGQLHLKFRGAAVERDGQRITIRLPAK
ncbi:MAG: hypothetical protein ABI877_18820 [Gemmatimonadaceae bacterium]